MEIHKINIFNKLLFIITIFFYSCNDNSLPMNPDGGNEYAYSKFTLNSSDSETIRLDNFNSGLSSRTYIGTYYNDLELYSLYKLDFSSLEDFDLCADTTILSIEEIGFKIIATQDLFDNYDTSIDSIDFSMQNMISGELFGPLSHIQAFYINDVLSFNEQDTLNHSLSKVEEIKTYITYEMCEELSNPGNCLLSSKFTSYQLSFILNDIYNTDSNQELISKEEICENTNYPFYILLNYNNPSEAFEDQLELFSADHSIGILNPSLYIKYNKSILNNVEIEKFEIDTIYSSYLEPSQYIYNSSMGSEASGTILSFSIDGFDLSSLDESFSFENSQNNLDTIIYANDSINDLFTFEISLNNEILDSLENINFYFDNYYFAYKDYDPSNDNWTELDSLREEGNDLYDIGENFTDFGYDGCPDEEEGGNNLCSIENSQYNIDGTEMNELLDWEDDGNNIWDPQEGEEWYDYGYDQVNDDFETGCFNDSYPYGLPINIPISYYEILSQGYENNENQEFYEYIYQNNENCNIEDQESCINNDFCVWSETLNTCSNLEIVICGSDYWIENNCSNCSYYDPNGDNYNEDPGNDNWEDLDSDLIWDDGEGMENNNQYDIGEPFLDFGIDQIPDTLEIYIDYEYPDDNWSETNLIGTEGNDLYDPGEIYFDTGIDSLFSINENNYNIQGKQDNEIFDFSITYIEKFNDYGIDNIMDGEEGDDPYDNYNEDPNQDNYHYTDNINGLDSNGNWDFTDFGIDGCINEYETGNIWENDSCSDLQFNSMLLCLCSENILNSSDMDLNNDDYNIDNNQEGTENNGILDFNEQYELWEDYGSDMLPDSLENNYMNNEVEIALGNNFYNLSFESMPYINDSINFDPPLINDDDQLSLWISSMKKIDDNKYKININAASLVDINGLQFQLSHFKYIDLIDTTQVNQTNLYPYEYEDQNGNNYPDDSEIIEGGEKYIQDHSIYTFREFESDSLSVSYGNGMISKLSFQGLEDFINENEYSMISYDLTKLIIYFNLDDENHYIDENNGVDFQFLIYDEIQDTLVPFEIIDDQTNLSLLDEINISASSDSIEIAIAPLIQKFILNEIPFDSWIYLSASDYSDNFSNISIIKEHISKSPRLEIFYLK